MAENKAARDNVAQTPRRRRENTGDTTEGKADSSVTEEGEALQREIDGVLDELDEILEEDSEEFVGKYVQRGGE